MKRFLIFTAFLFLALGVSAQSQKGNVTLAATVGVNAYIGQQDPGYSDTYEIEALNSTGFTNNISIGFDGNWFVTNNWAIRFGGGFGYSYKPGYSELIGTLGSGENDDSWDEGGVPNYRAVASTTDMMWSAQLGMNHYWQLKKVPQLQYYTGFKFGFSYSLYQTKYNESMSMGVALAQSYTGSISWTCGVDYYIFPAFYIGAEVQPVYYSYNVSGIRPQEGLALLQADSHNIGAFAMPTIKVGFRF